MLMLLLCIVVELKKRPYLCQILISQELCHAIKVMFVLLALLCGYLQEVLVRSSIVQNHKWLRSPSIHI